ncbi:MAG: hypothetical protein ACK5L3_05435 [Oscillospiraceae bacterium]
MICFPLDNTPYEAKDMGAYLAARTRGVYSAENNLAVSPGASGMDISVSSGFGWLKMAEFWGVAVRQEQAATFTLDPADGVLSRIDAVVAQLDKVTNKAEIIIKKGAYSSNPVIAAPTRNTNYDEIYIATVRIDPGATSITAADITDQRENEAYCGIMRDGVTGIPTAQLQDEWQAWFDSIKDILDENTAGNLLNMINAINTSVGVPGGIAALDALGVVKTATGDISGTDLHAITQTGFYHGSNVANAIDANPYYFIVLCQDENNAIILSSRADVNNPEWFVQTNVAGVWSWWINIDNGARWNSMPKTGGDFTGKVTAAPIDSSGPYIHNTQIVSSTGAAVNRHKIVFYEE